MPLTPNYEKSYQKRKTNGYETFKKRKQNQAIKHPFKIKGKIGYPKKPLISKSVIKAPSQRDGAIRY